MWLDLQVPFYRAHLYGSEHASPRWLLSLRADPEAPVLSKELILHDRCPDGLSKQGGIGEMPHNRNEVSPSKASQILRHLKDSGNLLSFDEEV